MRRERASVVEAVVPLCVLALTWARRATRAVGALRIGAGIARPGVARGAEICVVTVAVEKVADAHLAHPGHASESTPVVILNSADPDA